MGWSIQLKSKTKIEESEIEEIISKLPPEFSFPLGNSKQTWGWSTGADVSLRSENIVRLSGSYGMSGKIAESYAKYMKQQLEEKGHTIAIKENW